MIEFERQQFFFSRTKKEDDHLIWTGSFGPRGYGFMYFSRKQKEYAHRIAYCIANNLNPEDIGDSIILHLCDRTECVNPDHLFKKRRVARKGSKIE